MDQHRHWNKIAPRYEEEIFDVFASDRRKLLPKLLKKYAKPTAQAIDFGCGTGKAFPMLAPAFQSVHAVDISEGVIATAKKRPFRNISFQRADLSSTSAKLPVVDFLFCCNVVMLPEQERNRRMFRNMSRALKAGGSGLVVVPSTESIQYACWRMMDWYRREGVPSEDIPASEFHYFKGGKRDLLQGIFHIDSVPTKHYAAPELEVLLPEAGLELVALHRLEYDWTTEFASPPNWMQEPYPWDWLIELRKPS